MTRTQNRFLVCVLATMVVACRQTAQPQDEGATELPSLPSAISIAEITETTEIIDKIEIQSPGYGSSLLSPISLDLLVPPTTRLRIELVNEAGALLSRLVVEDPQSQTSLSIPFEVDRPTSALLIASIEDEYGRLSMLDSVGLQLVPGGENESVPFVEDFGIRIYSPLANATIEGGTLTVIGEAFTRPGRALTIQLVRRDGRVLATGETYPVFGQSVLGNYSLTLNYEIEETTWVLVAVSERQNGFIIEYAGLEVLLEP